MTSSPSDKRADDVGAPDEKRRSDGAGDGADHGKSHRRRGDRPDDAALDRGLEETFPASDPVPISPGSD